MSIAGWSRDEAKNIVMSDVVVVSSDVFPAVTGVMCVLYGVIAVLCYSCVIGFSLFEVPVYRSVCRFAPASVVWPELPGSVASEGV